MKDQDIKLIGAIHAHQGHTLYQINKQTLDIEEAKTVNEEWGLLEDWNKSILLNDECAYVSALNKKNALKKYFTGKTGTKYKDLNFLKLG